MLRRAIRAAVRRARKWLAEEPGEPSAQRHHDQDLFLYGWLNSIFMKVIAEEGGAQRPAYAWGVLHGVNLARALNIKRVSIIEFGVASGNGLIALEKIAKVVEDLFRIDIDVYGFDTGAGLPKPQDYRDLPNLWSDGYFPMDQKELLKRLQRARLILGDVKDTITEFINSKPKPVAFISFDLDMYSSTMHAFKLLGAEQNVLLPRIHCYFDDIMGFTYGDHNGERLAITEFNASHPLRKISQIYGLKYYLPKKFAQNMWPDKYYMAHILDHDLYGCHDGLVTKVGAEKATR